MLLGGGRTQANCTYNLHIQCGAVGAAAALDVGGGRVEDKQDRG